MHILAFDPSGNFKEGMGTTGVCDLGVNGLIQLQEIKATDHELTELYWNAHLGLIDSRYSIFRSELHVVMEGFRLYKSKAETQIQSQFETPQLIGVVRMHCFQKGIPLKIHYAAEVKTRWSEDVMCNLGILTLESKRYKLDGKQVSGHMRDSLKHALHYERYTSKKG